MKHPNLMAIEQALFTISVDSIRNFAETHTLESFYAFGLDCNADYGDVLLCVNTEEDFHTTSLHYIAKWNYGDKELADLKRNFGDWKYQGFNLNQLDWDEKWAPYKDAIEQYVFADPEDGEDEDELYERGHLFLEDLMRSFCHVLIRLEKSEILKHLNQDEGFYTHVQDHDEVDEDAYDRLNAVRAEFTI